MENLINNIDFRVWDLVFGHYNKSLAVKASRMKPDKKKTLIDLDQW